MSKTSRGKKICGYLKGIRRKIAEENDIKLDIPECTYEGECRGTCPRCEWEVQYLEKTLFERMKLGKIATISGLALGLTACGGNFDSQPDDDIMGDMPMPYPYEDVETLPPNYITKINIDTIAIDEDEEVGELAGLVAADAEFPGGEDALYDFIAKNLKYPQAAKDSNIQGKVFVQFVVEKDGSITNAKVLRDIGGGCGEETLRVVKMMPKWKPGEIRGTKYRVQCTLPVRFGLNKK
ncbi:MAG: energy transducer TonB [Bacteroidales bacterium]|nr:energy transducer TonB [Bacteroidales bacterium]